MRCFLQIPMVHGKPLPPVCGRMPVVPSWGTVMEKPGLCVQECVAASAVTPTQVCALLRQTQQWRDGISATFCLPSLRLYEKKKHLVPGGCMGLSAPGDSLSNGCSRCASHGELSLRRFLHLLMQFWSVLSCSVSMAVLEAAGLS